MNILLIHQYFLEQDDPGGSRFNEMTRVWVEDGHQVTVICGMLNYVTGKVPEKYRGLKFHRSAYLPGLDVMRCYVSPEYNTNFVGRLWAYFSFVFYGIYGSLFKMKGKKFDVIVATSPPLFIGIIAWTVSRIRRIPYVFEVRDLWPESAIDTGVLTNKWVIKFAYWFERFIYKNALLINVLTPAFRQSLVQKKSVQPGKVCFIPNACDFSMTDDLLISFNRAAFRKHLGWESSFVITYVGAHGVANHLQQLLEAADRLRSTKNIRIVLIGDGMQKQALIEMARQKDLNNVQFIDSLAKKDVMKYIMASDVGTSVLKRVDTFKTVYSNKTFDYMSCKTPILLLIDGVSRELVEAAGCGVYAEPENRNDIVAKIEMLKTSTTLREMGESGYHYAKRHFDRQVLAKNYIVEIENALRRVS